MIKNEDIRTVMRAAELLHEVNSKAAHDTALALDKIAERYWEINLARGAGVKLQHARKEKGLC